jgi:hypothetical protein
MRQTLRLHFPTNAEMNFAVAELLGWQWVSFSRYSHTGPADPTRVRKLMAGIPTDYYYVEPALATGEEPIDMAETWLPNYAGCRDLWPAVWKWLQENGRFSFYLAELTGLFPVDCQTGDAQKVMLHIVGPKLCLAALLLAFNRWPETWVLPNESV